MPTYEYECEACGHKLDLFQPINSTPKKVCPSCRRHKLRRLIGAGGGIIFKGSGFYQTDYRSEAYRKAASADQESSSPSTDSKSSTKKKDEKPCAKNTKAAD